MIKSFAVDHTKMYAPMIRLADTYEHKGVVIKKYDLRFVTPNTTYISDAIMHSMEHLLATGFKNIFGDFMIDLSPMGCKTGFYFTMFDIPDEDIVSKIKSAISEAWTVSIPVPTIKNCGSYYLHDIDTAREFIRKISEQLWRIKE